MLIMLPGGIGTVDEIMNAILNFKISMFLISDDNSKYGLLYIIPTRTVYVYNCLCTVTN